MNKLPEKSPNVTSIFVWSVIVGSSLGIKPPFISEWQTIMAQGQSPIYIPHSLGEMPIKVDVQVRVVREGSQHIFPGFGAGQRSDENGDSQYGAVLCSYNESHVRLHVPVSTITTKGGLVSTGMTPLFFKVSHCTKYCSWAEFSILESVGFIFTRMHWEVGRACKCFIMLSIFYLHANKKKS